MLAARFRHRNPVLGEGTGRAGGLDSSCTWEVGDRIEFGHWQSDGGDATGEEDVRRCERFGTVMPVTKVSTLDIIYSYKVSIWIDIIE